MCYSFEFPTEKSTTLSHSSNGHIYKMLKFQKDGMNQDFEKWKNKWRIRSKFQKIINYFPAENLLSY